MTLPPPIPRILSAEENEHRDILLLAMIMLTEAELELGLKMEDQEHVS
jgi:hypothetical protein